MSITNLREQLCRDEGTRLKPYLDCCSKSWRDCTCKVKGFLTIGVGRNLESDGISMAESDFLLDNSILAKRAEVLSRIPWALRLDEARREALVNIAYNCGVDGLLGFKHALAAMEAGDYAGAAAHFRDSKWHKQVGPRADRLCAQITDGEWH